jgi:hypothetical protein
MGEFRCNSSFDFQRERLLIVNAGLMRRIRDNVVLYANVGRSVFADEDIRQIEATRHIYVGAGVKFLLTPGSTSTKK